MKYLGAYLMAVLGGKELWVRSGSLKGVSSVFRLWTSEGLGLRVCDFSSMDGHRGKVTQYS